MKRQDTTKALEVGQQVFRVPTLVGYFSPNLKARLKSVLQTPVARGAFSPYHRAPATDRVIY